MAGFSFLQDVFRVGRKRGAVQGCNTVHSLEPTFRLGEMCQQLRIGARRIFVCLFSLRANGLGEFFGAQHADPLTCGPEFS